MGRRQGGKTRGRIGIERSFARLSSGGEVQIVLRGSLLEPGNKTRGRRGSGCTDVRSSRHLVVVSMLVVRMYREVLKDRYTRRCDGKKRI